MKKILGYSILMLTLILATTSCDDILDQKAVDAFNEESVFQDINLTKAFLGKCYDYIGGDDNDGSNNATLGLREDILAGATDECLCIHRPGSYPSIKGIMTPDELGHFGGWRFSWVTWRLYNNIKNVNLFLANVDEVPTETNDEADQLAIMKGEAYFIRAFDFANLMRSYGGVVLTTDAFELEQDFLSIQRSSIDETLAQILDDCDKAIAALPESGMEQGRATKGAAAALKSRILSWSTGELMNGGYEPSNPLVSFQSGTRTQRLEAAKTAAKAIIDGTYGFYSLTGTTDDPPANMTKEDIMAYAENFESIFTQRGTWNNESIWGIQYLQAQGNRTTQNRWWGPNGYHNWGNNGPVEPLVRKFEMADGTPFVWDKYNPGDEFVREATAAELEADPEINPYVGREPRFYATVLYDGAEWQARSETNGLVQVSYYISGSDTTSGIDTRQSYIESWNGTKTGYYLKKYQDPATEGQYYNNENAWIEMRYAEVLMDYAEACIELGEVEEGMNVVNMIRNRAGLPDRDVSTNQEQAREWYRHERQIEFYGEGDRWYMMRKWMIADEVIKNVYPMYIYHYDDGSSKWVYSTDESVDDRAWIDTNYWLPLSRTETNKAPQLQQNPGYE
ncbi:RagB/SusD family nutrient uptake outer membrane protein [Maribellus maritimus]|uniref:RagB/SusD family nutrient uptake outer membrane protein n=1 Tax=Maribellus maritimus TaxID=2870838 RepID=UPI001EEB0957|nr:RagB/SusD family nutrient uptake outer membrane protein [Maribellus maritimus]MCG6189215.1 RagB/SusD family nutrient uptake outer membrane protein [Maribellus maritimus]